MAGCWVLPFWAWGLVLRWGFELRGKRGVGSQGFWLGEGREGLFLGWIGCGCWRKEGGWGCWVGVLEGVRRLF